MIDILNRSKLFEILKTLKADKQAIFGTMTPQHMVEHLALAVGFSNGNSPQRLYYPIAKAEKIKSVVIYTDKELPVGFKTPVLSPDQLPVLKYANLNTAIENLRFELTDFDDYFFRNPSAKPIHPVAGELTHKEWIVFHNKHFTHHFKQFELLKEQPNIGH